ncbi:MAG: hypothetical protein SNG47_07870, partial [Rikenellaceae bacterium]
MKKIFNILLGVLLAITAALMIYAVVAGGSQAAIGANLMWGYFLVVFGLASAVACAVVGMIDSPSGIKQTILSIVLVLVVVGASYAFAANNTVQITNIENGGVFDAGETVITETSVLVTYVAVAA